MPRSTTIRIEFTDEHDKYLAKYLAKYSLTKENRSGNTLFRDLVADRKKQWPWAVHHPWQSWRQRYVKNQAFFDARIARYQARDATTQKRENPADPSFEMAGPSAKRIKLEANTEQEQEDKREGPSVQIHTNAQNAKPATPKACESEVQPRTPRYPRTNADQDSLERPASSPTRQAAPLGDKPAKQLTKRLREPSEAFTSAPSSPKKDPDSSLQTQLAPSSSVSTYNRAPPRFMNSFDGQVLVDQKGRVPRAFPSADRGEEEEVKQEEIVEDEVCWPPLRHRAAEQKKASEPNVEVDKHHAFSQPQMTLPMEKDADGERRHPFEMDRHTIVAQFISGVRVESERAVRNGASSTKRTLPRPPEPHVTSVPKSSSESPSEGDADGERRHPFELDIGDVLLVNKGREGAMNGTSPAKRIVPLPPEPRAGPAPKPLKFVAPYPSTIPPFGPESPTKATRPSKSRSRLSWTKAARHPALTRIQRQDGSEVHAPSIDFVALSRSSASVRSSRSSRASVRPPRWSLPGVPRVPWVDEHGASSAPGSAMGSRSRSGSGSGVASPFRWRLPAHDERNQAASITYTPSPARSLTAAGAMRSPALTRVALHSADVDVVCSHGLASFLTHMAANHGLALSVVEEVYGRLGNLEAADEVLRGMREAAQGFGEREIERRLQNRVDQEEEEYLPPETSRAAMWRRREMQRAEEEEVEEQHDSSRASSSEVEEAAMAEALVEHLPAQALQRRVGHARFRKAIMKYFV